jgi:predicted Zn-dependent peptidase
MEFISVPFKGLNNKVIHLRGLAGSNYDKKGAYGTAHLTEHLISSSNIFTSLIDRGVKIISVTSRDDVLYMFKCSNRDFSWVLESILQIFNTLTFTQEQLEKQKELVLQEISRFESSPEKLIARIGLKNVFLSDRLNDYNVGTLQDIKKLNVDAVNDFINKYYYPGNFVLTITGDVDKNKIRSVMKDCVSSVKPKAARLKLTANFELVINTLKKTEFKQTYVRINFAGYPLSHKYSLYLDVLSELLDKSLKLSLKGKRLPIYDLGCTNYSSYNYGVLTVYFSCQSFNQENNLKEISQTIKDFSHQLNPTVFEKGKQQVITQLSYDMDKASYRGDYFSTLHLFGSPIKDYKTLVQAIRYIQFETFYRLVKKFLQQKPKLTIINDVVGETKVKKMFN